MTFVRIGKGVSILMEKAMYRYTNYPSVKIIDPEPKMPIDIYIAWNRNTENRRVVRLFARFIENRMNEAGSAEKEDFDEDRVSE